MPWAGSTIAGEHANWSDYPTRWASSHRVGACSSRVEFDGSSHRSEEDLRRKIMYQLFHSVPTSATGDRMALEEIGVEYQHWHRHYGSRTKGAGIRVTITWHGHQESFGLCAVRTELVWTTTYDVVAVVAVVTLVSATRRHELRSVVVAGPMSGTLVTSLVDSVLDVPRSPLLLAPNVTIALTYSLRGAGTMRPLDLE